jgi:hypothetical protein
MEATNDHLELEVFATIEDDPDGLQVEEPAKELIAKVLQSKQGKVISLKTAEMRIGTRILEVLDEKFKGKLTEARHPDALDRLF